MKLRQYGYDYKESKRLWSRLWLCRKCSSNVHTNHFLSIFVQAMSLSIAIALEYNVSFINLNDRQMYLHTHTHTHTHPYHFPNISLKFVQAMTCAIAIALEHIAIRYAKQRKQNYEIFTPPHQHTTMCEWMLSLASCILQSVALSFLNKIMKSVVLIMKWLNDVNWKIFWLWNGRMISHGKYSTKWSNDLNDFIRHLPT